MEDLELIEKYFRKELTPEELAQFQSRLAGDSAFKQKFEAESLVHKALQFSREKERMKSYAVNTVPVPAVPAQWLDNRTLISIGATALAVWIFSTFSSSLTSLSPDYIKWVGMVAAVGGSIVLLALKNKTMSIRLAFTGFFNGLLVFVLASGIDAINHGAEGTPMETLKAYLIPFTGDKPWWPTQSLEDSLEANRIQIQKLHDNIKNLVTSRLNAGPLLTFGSAGGKFTPVIVPRSTDVTSGSNYEADVFLAMSPEVQKFEMSVDGKPITLVTDPSGVRMGKVSFTATANQFDQTGTAKKKFLVAIKLRDSTYTKVVEYNVVKPR